MSDTVYFAKLSDRHSVILVSERIRDRSPDSWVQITEEMKNKFQAIREAKGHPIWIDGDIHDRFQLTLARNSIVWNEAEEKLEIVPPPPPPPLPPLEALAASGVEVAPGIVLGASETDITRWSQLLVHLDRLHDQASIDANATWEQVRPAFNSQPVTVLKKDGTPWDTTIGVLREALATVGNAYMTAWAQNSMPTQNE